VLTVAWLGAGSAWLQLQRRTRDALLGGLLVATLAAAVAVGLAPVHATMLAHPPSGGPPADGPVRPPGPQRRVGQRGEPGQDAGDRDQNG